jgi:hypothetical protein
VAAGLALAGVGLGTLWGNAVVHDELIVGSGDSDQYATLNATLSTLDADTGDYSEFSAATGESPVLTGWGFDQTDAAAMETAVIADRNALPVVNNQVRVDVSNVLGNIGLDYSISVPTPDPNSWAGNSTMELWMAPTDADPDSYRCSAVTPPQTEFATTGTLIDPDYQNTAHAGKTATRILCLRMTFNGAGSYMNTGTFTAPTPAGEVNPATPEKSATWGTDLLIPDASLDGWTIPITLEPVYSQDVPTVETP